jgi:hypothetical protein
MGAGFPGWAHICRNEDQLRMLPNFVEHFVNGKYKFVFGTF